LGFPGEAHDWAKARQKALRDEVTLLPIAREEGIEKGREEGREEATSKTAEDISEQIRPEPPQFLRAYQPHLRYYLIDEGRYTASSPRSPPCVC
jgi:hypothetical protein